MLHAAWYQVCVAGNDRADGFFSKTSDDSGVTGVACDYCFMEHSVKSHATNERSHLVLVCKFYRNRWVTVRGGVRSGDHC